MWKNFQNPTATELCLTVKENLIKSTQFGSGMIDLSVGITFEALGIIY
jgi:hypothetical protein